VGAGDGADVEMAVGAGKRVGGFEVPPDDAQATTSIDMPMLNSIRCFIGASVLVCSDHLLAGNDRYELSISLRDERLIDSGCCDQ
jgi:hypothetical protein